MAVTIKNERQIKAMRKGGKILAEVLEEVCKRAKPGVCTLELDQFAEEFIRNNGGEPSFKGYQGFPNTLCTALNAEVVHGIPNKNQVIQEGDLFTVDCGVFYKGMHTDAARSIGIGEISEEKKQLIKVAEETLEIAIKMAKPGILVNELGAAIEDNIHKYGYKIIHDLSGHGIGKTVHEDPVVYNYYDKNSKTKLKPGMTIAIEPIFAVGTSQIITLSDNWTLITQDNSLSVQAENTILITENGNEVLTKS